jgi:large subunit ribosomal protein L14
VVVRQKKPYRRKDGTWIRFEENAVVLLKGENEPLGNRILGPIPREIKEKGFEKIANLAEELV